MLSPETTPLSIKSYPARLVNKIPLPYWMSLLILWEIIFLGDYIYSFNIPGGHNHIAAFGTISLFFASICINTVYCSKVLVNLYPDLALFIDHDQRELRTWHEQKLKWCYQGVWPLLAGILFAFLEDFTIGDVARSFTPDDSVLQNLRSGYRVVGFFFLGVSLWALINVLIIPMQLIQFRIRIRLNQLSGRGLQALGSSFFKMSIAITSSFVLIIITTILAGLGNNFTVLLWEGLGAALIFCFFLLPQIGIHRIMSNEKEQRILSFSHHLEQALEKSLDDPSSENMQRLKELFELQEHLKTMNEWPFNVNTLWQLITALLIPLLLALLEIVF